MSTKLMSGDALVTQEYWSITGPLGEGTMMTFSPDPRKNPAAAPVVAGVPRQGHRAGGLYPLHLRRDPGVGGRGQGGRQHRHRQGHRQAALRHLRYRPGADQLRRKGRCQGARLCVLRLEGWQVRLRAIVADAVERQEAPPWKSVRGGADGMFEPRRAPPLRLHSPRAAAPVPGSLLRRSGRLMARSSGRFVVPGWRHCAKCGTSRRTSENICLAAAPRT